MSDAAPLRVEHLSVELGGQGVLRDVSVTAASGEWLGVIGPNGSGKTTLLRAVSGAVAGDGRIELFGKPLTSWAAHERAQRVAMVRQQSAVSFDLTVRDVVMLGRAPHRGWFAQFGANDAEVVEAAMDEVDVDAYADRSLTSLSGGEVQRAFLAQALAQDADLLLLDEPTTHLDVHYQFSLLDAVRRQVEYGRAVIAVVHDLEHAARYSDRLIVLDEGRCVASGTPREVLTPELIADVFGMSAAVQPSSEGLRIDYHAPV
jgi:iron complex transport system ATP-binding protein